MWNEHGDAVLSRVAFCSEWGRSNQGCTRIRRLMEQEETTTPEQPEPDSLEAKAASKAEFKAEPEATDAPRTHEQAQLSPLTQSGGRQRSRLKSAIDY